MDIVIRPLKITDEIPYHLLLLADPAKHLVDDYLSRGLCFVATIENKTVGVFVLIHTHPRTVEIVNIAVKEDFQGKGIGRKLVERALEEARKLHANRIEIGTGNSSLKQLALYQKCGFRVHGIDFDFFIRNYEEEIYEDGIQCRDMIRLKKDL
ncbi:GNAT family N-acetyltransferase [Paenibacillus abyssi]|uniref:N-acetyltransferase YvbK n=1 Tax=Paenibacillus abyssi TaxID=1340531 RepID=A0A917D8P6_9BACL|nr:GNAT family N-acetyltransferase [Paenibacillus abyssi]GGG13722.1 putative N-acetyltransferase YvbK [Paenibacillus abyssi]